MAEEVEKQLARTLTNAQRAAARHILQLVAAEIERVAPGDPDLSFRLRRYIHARLQLKNRPSERLRRDLFDRQNATCSFCRKPITKLKGTDMHRLGPGRYTEDNTVLLHRDCHEEQHRREGTALEDDVAAPRDGPQSQLLGDIDTSPESRTRQYYLTPARNRGQVPAMEWVRRDLAAGKYCWGEKTPYVRSLRPGDRICFYATANVGIVAQAAAASEAQNSGAAGDAFLMCFSVAGYQPVDPPIEVDADLRSKLEWFKGRDPFGSDWADFVRSTHPISEHDFRLLTGEG